MVQNWGVAKIFRPLIVQVFFLQPRRILQQEVLPRYQAATLPIANLPIPLQEGYKKTSSWVEGLLRIPFNCHQLFVITTHHRKSLFCMLKNIASSSSFRPKPKTS